MDHVVRSGGGPWRGKTVWIKDGIPTVYDTHLYRLDAGRLRPLNVGACMNTTIPLFVAYFPDTKESYVALYFEVPLQRVPGDRNSWVWRDAIVNFTEAGEPWVGYVVRGDTPERPTWALTEDFTHSTLDSWEDTEATPTIVAPHWVFTEHPADVERLIAQGYCQEWSLPNSNPTFYHPRLCLRAHLRNVGFDSTVFFDGFRYPQWPRPNELWWTKDLTGIHDEFYITFQDNNTWTFGYIANNQGAFTGGPNGEDSQDEDMSESDGDAEDDGSGSD
eukprot:CAMPEP_0184715080 /NCGR_PEP_ID=MMETSP0314-20130426/5079_1 /TAXON_ID=38298 /ORGANISM="Rhodella maculata, Strain CCMP 736" /LENGTH=274 /DNA_ID=CAMNT_0027178133 /DNA_START=119 /DNA_END=943 /DNA_ORIENTATION=-